ncbi:MAG: asparagine synthase (glutamine-hydrolyzing) [Gemmatimonadales bacterium]|nr:MAG: asparagine synthase (glutamine-hydrolyzing) [Gemmatimonadales bacterium]
MSQALKHRGPDDQGLWEDPGAGVGLAFRRLSILDLTPAGRQPMASESGRFVMVFNGEVYNFRDLRDELRRDGVTFRGDSDSEVVVNALERWGVEVALNRFVGMFALALWDTRDQVLWLTRDRMGIKPLYLARVPGGLAFASELGALLRDPETRFSLDPNGLDLYLRYLYLPAPFTPFRGIRKLRPGHLVRIPLGEAAGSGPSDPPPEGEPWWSVARARRGGEEMARTAPGPEPGHDAAAVDHLEALLRDAVSLRMIADVPLGALLSGGVDSSVVVALMQQLSTSPVRTFTIGFDDPTHDESDHARAVARHLGTEHTELPVSGREALDVVPSLPGIFDEPLADPSQIPTWLVSRLARRDVTVALTGDGGDELFAGYTRHAAGGRLIPRTQRLPGLPRRLMGRALQGVSEPTWDRLAAWAPGAGAVRLAGQKAHKLGRMMAAPSAAEAYRTLLSTRAQGLLRTGGVGEGAGGDDPLAALLHGGDGGDGTFTLGAMLEADQTYYLPDDLLQKVDRASMAVSLEARVPLLDHRVVEWSWTLPDHLKIRAGEGKWLLRQLLYRHVPRALVDRPKTGFTVPLALWLRGPLKGWAQELLLAPSPERDHLFHPAAVRRAWTDFAEGRSQDALTLWSLLMFEAWRAEWSVAPD